MRSAVAIAELRLCHAAARVESCLADEATRRTNAEALQRALYIHADEIMRLIDDHEAGQSTITRLARALVPFGRVAGILAPGQNPVVLSVPAMTEAGRTFVQLRPADFRLAAAEIAELAR